jgi:hypothetical protein
MTVAGGSQNAAEERRGRRVLGLKARRTRKNAGLNRAIAKEGRRHPDLKEGGYTIEPAAARLMAVRADRHRHARGDSGAVDVYIGGRKAITVEHLQAIVSGETLQISASVAIVQKDARRALRSVTAFERSALILGQLILCEKMWRRPTQARAGRNRGCSART